MYTPGAPCISPIENRLTLRILYFYFWSLRIIRAVRCLVILCLLEHKTLTNLAFLIVAITSLIEAIRFSENIYPSPLRYDHSNFNADCQSIVYLSIFNALNLSHSIEICELQCAPATLPILFCMTFYTTPQTLKNCTVLITSSLRCMCAATNDLLARYGPA